MRKKLGEAVEEFEQTRPELLYYLQRLPGPAGRSALPVSASASIPPGSALTLCSALRLKQSHVSHRPVICQQHITRIRVRKRPGCPAQFCAMLLRLPGNNIFQGLPPWEGQSFLRNTDDDDDDNDDGFPRSLPAIALTLSSQ
eukprot:2565754-Rhodomonas_salina.1